ncbi:MAG: DUF4271 domain-containing protein [Muribaculaceae bacterium]|nr:DUF4271 domain-containing protein [Muribaculaceae bacterium]
MSRHDSDTIEIFNRIPADTVYQADSAACSPKPEIAILDTIPAVPARPEPYMSGHEPAVRPYNTSADSAILGTYALFVLLIAFNITHLRRLLSVGIQDLISVRHRDNVFDDHTTSESRAGIILVAHFCFSAAIILYFALTQYSGLIPTPATPLRIGSLTCLCAGYYIFLLCGYSTVGYAFAPDKALIAQWIKGFRASFAYLSLGLLAVAPVALFYPAYAINLGYVALTLFCITKLIFIIKGFRIFYYNFWSLLYFILYLCSLEIIPVLIVYFLSLRLLGSS